MLAVVDTYGSFGFGKLYTTKRKETATDILNDRVLPFYQAYGLDVKAVLTDNWTEYKGRPMVHLYEIFLLISNIEYQTTRVDTPRTKVFVERFNRTFWMNSPGPLLGRNSTSRWMNFRRSRTLGSIITITSGLIAAIETIVSGL